MNLTDLELVRTQVPCHVIILHKLLQRPMFRTCFVQISLLLRNNRRIAQLFKVKARMKELSICRGWHSVKIFSCVKQISCYLSGGTLS